MSLRIFLATGLAVLLAPATAQAATLTVGGACFAAGGTVPVTGAGFTPGVDVTVGGDGFATATADATGAFTATVRAPFVAGAVPETFTLVAEESMNPASTATVRFPVVRDAFYVEANLNGNPRGTVRWHFAGFPTGKSIYGHFRFRGKTLRNHRFGRAKGPCGTLSARAKRLPVKKLRYGTWKLKFDTRKSYSAKSAGRLGTIRIFRSS